DDLAVVSNELALSFYSPTLALPFSLSNFPFCNTLVLPSPLPHLSQPNQRLGVTPDATTFNTLLKACAAHSRPDAAQLLYLDVYTYSTVIQILAQAGRFQAAFAVKSDMDQSGVPANVVTWTSLIGTCARAGFVDHAFRVFEEMVGSGCEATTAVYNLMIDMCAEAGLEDRAVGLLREMQAGGRRKGEKGEKGDEVIKACTGSPQRARAFVGEMRAAGIAPNERTWVALLDCHGTNADTNAAVQVSVRAAGIHTAE
ncbi:unnamed protein product, partial [Closterium sp. Yama58-4]